MRASRKSLGYRNVDGWAAALSRVIRGERILEKLGCCGEGGTPGRAARSGKTLLLEEARRLDRLDAGGKPCARAITRRRTGLALTPVTLFRRAAAWQPHRVSGIRTCPKWALKRASFAIFETIFDNFKTFPTIHIHLYKSVCLSVGPSIS